MLLVGEVILIVDLDGESILLSEHTGQAGVGCGGQTSITRLESYSSAHLPCNPLHSHRTQSTALCSSIWRW